MSCDMMLYGLDIKRGIVENYTDNTSGASCNLMPCNFVSSPWKQLPSKMKAHYTMSEITSLRFLQEFSED